MAKSKVTTEVVNITPKLALAWLEANTHNRAIRQHKVDEYARDMGRGDWILTHQGIAFNCNGTLVDGQHRLWAVIESKKTIPMAVSHGLAVESQLVIDCPEVRRTADFLTLTDIWGVVPRLHGAVLKRMMQGASARGGRLTHTEEAEAYGFHRQAIKFAVDCFSRRAPRLSSAAVFAVIARAYYSAFEKDDIRVFCEMLVTGKTTKRPRDASVIVLRDALIYGLHGRALPSTEIYRKVQHALETFLENRVITTRSRLGIKPHEIFTLPRERHGYRPQGGRSADTMAGRIYRCIRANGKPMKSSAIAARLRLDVQDVATAAKRAVAQGILTRQRVSEDGKRLFQYDAVRVK